MDLSGMTEAELDTLKARIETETSKRAVLDNAEAMLRELNQNVLNAEGIKFGDPWRQPTGAHDAYSKGWEVSDEGAQWESTINGNVWKPGVSGWKKKAAPGGYPDFVQPSGSHDAYKKTDKVRFNNKNYESLIDNNVWSPTNYPQGWKELS